MDFNEATYRKELLDAEPDAAAEITNQYKI
jgi:hypothetical protein